MEISVSLTPGTADYARSVGAGGKGRTITDTIERLRMDVKSAQLRATGAENQRTAWGIELHAATERAEKAEAERDQAMNSADAWRQRATDAEAKLDSAEAERAACDAAMIAPNSRPVRTQLQESAERKLHVAEAEIERLRPIVDAARSWGRAQGIPTTKFDLRLLDALAALTAEVGEKQ